jgi:hypothetical protein
LHKRRSTPTKGLPSLQTIDIIVTKIAAMPLTVHPAIAVVTDGPTATVEPPVDRKHVATSARKKIADHKSIQIRNGQERKRPTKASSITVQTDASTITLRNGSSSTSLSAKKEVTKIQRQRQMTPLKA